MEFPSRRKLGAGDELLRFAIHMWVHGGARCDPFAEGQDLSEKSLEMGDQNAELGRCAGFRLRLLVFSFSSSTVKLSA